MIIHIALYADDIVFYLSHKNVECLNDSLTLAATQFSRWCSYNKFTLNLGKTKIVIFNNSTHKIASEFRYKPNERLNFNCHIKMLKQQILKVICCFNMLI